MVILDMLRQFGPDAKRLHDARKESKRQMDGLKKQVQHTRRTRAGEGRSGDQVVK
jgi:hypothetical protein